MRLPLAGKWHERDAETLAEELDAGARVGVTGSDTAPQTVATAPPDLAVAARQAADGARLA